MLDNKEIHVHGSTVGFQTIMHTGDHTVVIDEPYSEGGHDAGPDPLKVLLTSLAGCENAVANLVANEMDFDLQSIHFDIKANYDPRGLAGKADVQPYFSKVTLDAKVKTSEPEERIAQLQKETNQRCPVYATFDAAGIEMESSWTGV
ncbi:OsmC family protein [Radiobacillus kanasensis]|uniref:OsmC family protein n=1 Tax=Radiobacillus kanasensis TaxID=2844358 RepID=UPI001E41F4B6|nr:OsmC family protein [Radiobacillus kanasensis]UFT99721.1 OsmC family protein [Radiobacillus kanasensis]